LQRSTDLKNHIPPYALPHVKYEDVCALNGNVKRKFPGILKLVALRAAPKIRKYRLHFTLVLFWTLNLHAKPLKLFDNGLVSTIPEGFTIFGV
jgi:hypothetical protein